MVVGTGSYLGLGPCSPIISRSASFFSCKNEAEKMIKWGHYASIPNISIGAYKNINVAIRTINLSNLSTTYVPYIGQIMLSECKSFKEAEESIIKAWNKK